jgi:hypothetical protein
LPFDLRHVRWPLFYHLPEDATPEVKAEVKRKLVKDLSFRIRTCLRDLPEIPAAPRFVPFTDLRAWAFEAGWNGDVHAATLGDNDWMSFCKRLRQAAVDGAIPFTGRRYVYDFGEEADDQPQIAIPRAHFDEYGFDIVQLATAPTTTIFSQAGSAFLRASSRAASSATLRSMKPKPGRGWLKAASRLRFRHRRADRIGRRRDWRLPPSLYAYGQEHRQDRSRALSCRNDRV